MRKLLVAIALVASTLAVVPTLDAQTWRSSGGRAALVDGHLGAGVTARLSVRCINGQPRVGLTSYASGMVKRTDMIGETVRTRFSFSGGRGGTFTGRISSSEKGHAGITWSARDSRRLVPLLRSASSLRTTVVGNTGGVRHSLRGSDRAIGSLSCVR